MFRYKDVTIRKFQFEDIPLKIKWINDNRVNVHLHYDLPLEYNKTCQWYKTTTNDPNRFDGIIEFNGVPIGIVGVTNIDFENRCGEDYLVVGEVDYWGKGIATKAGILNTLYAKEYLKLDYLYGLIEYDNISSINQAVRRGAKFDSLLPNYYENAGKLKDAYKVKYYPENIPSLEGVYDE